MDENEQINETGLIDFLMTYGWAVLVILAAIGALWFFGILSADMFNINVTVTP